MRRFWDVLIKAPKELVVIRVRLVFLIDARSLLTADFDALTDSKTKNTIKPRDYLVRLRKLKEQLSRIDPIFLAFSSVSD